VGRDNAGNTSTKNYTWQKFYFGILLSGRVKIRLFALTIASNFAHFACLFSAACVLGHVNTSLEKPSVTR
jgi:hypothetical protein